jgi:hypothetical protein
MMLPAPQLVGELIFGKKAIFLGNKPFLKFGWLSFFLKSPEKSKFRWSEP